MVFQHRVLIITYYWPPAGGPGVQRILKFCKYLALSGWQPIVLTVQNGNFPALDETLLSDIPEAALVFKTYCPEPFSFFNLLKGKKPRSGIPTYVLSSSKQDSPLLKIAQWIRANLFIPDARIGWFPFLYRKAKQIIKEYQPEIIFSTSPPHSLQPAAARLSRQSGIPLVCDLRDPWTDAFWLKGLKRTRFAWEKDKKLEKSVLNQAAEIITVSNGLRELFAEITSTPISVIHNGYDEEDFSACTYKKNTRFRICHTGNVRLPQLAVKFFDSIDKLPPQIQSNLEIWFYGNMHPEVRQYIEKSDAAGVYHFPGYVSHQQVIQEICASDLLLVFSPVNAGSRGVLTAKLFEYLRTGKYIIAYGERGCEINEILRETGCGDFFSFDEYCSQRIIELYKKWQNGEDTIYGNDQVKKYSRARQTDLLVEVFQKLL